MTQAAAKPPDQTPGSRKVSPLLAIGIVFIPGIFVWFLLRGGHSTLSRVIGFVWMAFLLVFSQAIIAGINALPEAPEKVEADMVEAEIDDAPSPNAIEPDASEAPEAAAREAEPPVPAPRATISSEERRGMHCLNGWDGSHWKMQSEIKRRLRDPDSFEHVETRIAPIDEVGNHSIFMSFRARNGFGGMNVQQAIGVVDNKACELQVLQML